MTSNLIQIISFAMQEVGLESMKICVRDLLGSGSGHDHLTVTYAVIGGWFSLFLQVLNNFFQVWRFSESFKVSVSPKPLYNYQRMQDFVRNVCSVENKLLDSQSTTMKLF